MDSMAMNIATMPSPRIKNMNADPEKRSILDPLRTALPDSSTYSCWSSVGPGSVPCLMVCWHQASHWWISSSVRS